jgi:16S rRNA (cytosine1402-N4)-methyltransferase
VERGSGFEHLPVLAEECVGMLDIRPDGTYIDGTVGGAGHAARIFGCLGPEGTLVGIDRDAEAVAAARRTLEGTNGKARLHIVQSNYRDMKAVCRSLGIGKADGILLDLGVSSHQLDAPERGFSFRNDGPLDMRMDRDGTLTAEYVVNHYGEDRIREILYRYGEEKWAARIARFICEARAAAPIRTTSQLETLVRKAVPAKARQEGIHPATRTFQAIRIEVNGELSDLPGSIGDAMDLLGSGGRMCVITFHSLEDRIVKQAFQRFVKPCVCPPDAPRCVCGKEPVGEYPGPRLIRPTEAETEANPRARSAKLRVIRKL